ncbi:CMP-N-acetylneuraminate-beta-galactosamide-alpha-2,3-sialyltransferase 1-like isoform X1 [Fundulus heteroclitus]|uniref:CMP-N-acetylneuraminate-beta-galactosamide- alpha-2,3-sialyltransferase 1-like isoform X1 n=1 Tax=Fundulus heteroclitus TaxID=8078 RepID=UPI00165B0719|nr:CMP-N-acetylneuraminate-beta-galactosamide-alpha-2,3-sialyltransferase 1-like isoform X1 [Fundulus heteroclitus]
MYSFIRTFQVKLLFFLLVVAAVTFFLPADFPELLQLQHQDQSLCACEKCLSEENLFILHRLNRSEEPFLSSNTNLSEDAFRWWKLIQNEQRDFGSYKATVHKLFELFPSVADLGKPSADSCRTCAVVGNSVNLKGSRYGPLIDFQDVVIRMNAAPVKDYERDVGTKTTHRVMYPESAVDLDNSTHLVLFPFKIQDLEWVIKAFTTGFFGRSYAPLKSKIKAKRDLVMVINPAFMKYVHEIWLEKKGDYPSTGFMALILALQICDEVHVFGYGADHDGNWSHYFEKLKSKSFKTGPHPGQHEYALIQQLAEKKSVRLYKGW